MSYVFSLIRFVPDPAAGECVNVGAIIGSDDTAEWVVQRVHNITRARSIATNKNCVKAMLCKLEDIESCVQTYLDQDETNLEPDFTPSKSWLSRLHEESNNVLQFSRPTPVSVSSIQEAIDLVFGECIVDPASRTFDFKKKTTALAAMRKAYSQAGLVKNQQFLEKIIVKTDKYEDSFDFAVRNGRVVQLTQSWSFQLPEQRELAEEVKAWAWTVREVRSHGGQLVSKGGPLLDVPKDVDIEVLYIQPGPKSVTTAFSQAIAAFSALKVQAVPVEDAEKVGARAVKLLGR